jgi:single-stranded DNA-binding protein
VVGRLKQDRWAGPEGQTRSKVSIVAEHVEFKPQMKKDGDGKDGEAAAAEAPAEASAETADEQVSEETELKEAVGAHCCTCSRRHLARPPSEYYSPPTDLEEGASYKEPKDAEAVPRHLPDRSNSRVHR